MTRTAQQIYSLLIDLGLLSGDNISPEFELKIVRVYAGHWQRSGGAWSWYAVDQHGNCVVGSVWNCK